MLEKMCGIHPTRRALHSCRKCGRPICDQCVDENGGRFCSPECAGSFQDFQQRVSDRPAPRRRRFSILGCLRTFVVSIILLLVIWVAMWQLLGTTDPTAMWKELSKIWRLAF